MVFQGIIMVFQGITMVYQGILICAGGIPISVVFLGYLKGILRCSRGNPKVFLIIIKKIVGNELL